MARTLVLDTITDPDNSTGNANITLSPDSTTTLPKVDINSGAIDNTTLGAATPSSVAATTLSASGNATVGGTLGVTGVTTLSGNATVGGTLGVTGTTTLATLITGSMYLKSSNDGKSFFIGNSYVPTPTEDNNDAVSGLNTGMGWSTMQDLTSGYWNASFGYNSLSDLTSGHENATFGTWSGQRITTGVDNTASGSSALANVTTGSKNVGLGFSAGSSITTTSNNILIGHKAGSSNSHPGGIVTGSNQLCIGDDEITHAFVEVDWTIASDERDKADIVPMTHGLDVIKNINPINFVWDKRAAYTSDGELTSESTSDGSKKQSDNRLGFSAQNVKEALDEVGYEGHCVVNSQNPIKFSLSTTNIIPFLVNAIKELSAKVKALESA